MITDMEGKEILAGDTLVRINTDNAYGKLEMRIVDAVGEDYVLLRPRPGRDRPSAIKTYANAFRLPRL